MVLKQRYSPKGDERSAELNDAWQLLLQMRENFVQELPLRIEKLEQLILDLKQPKAFTVQLAELMRETHSLKGSGGTYGLPFISSVCHHLEEAYLGIDSSQAQLSESMLNHFLEYIDVMKDALALLENDSDFSRLETRLHDLKDKRLVGFSALLISASRSVQQLCRSLVADLHHIDWRQVEDGYVALGHLLQEHFDFIVMSNELARLSGEGVLAALRLSAGINRHTPVILLSSSDSLTVPEQFRADIVVKRDGDFMTSLSQALSHVVSKLAA